MHGLHPHSRFYPPDSPEFSALMKPAGAGRRSPGRGPPAIRHHYMIKNPNPDRQPGLRHLAGDCAIFGRRRRISRRVVVDQDDRRGTLDDGGAEDLPGVNQGSVEDSPRDGHVAQDPMLRVEEQRVKLLVGEIAQTRSHEGMDICRASDPGSIRQSLLCCPTPQLESGQNARCGGRSDPRDGFQIRRCRTQKGAEPPPRAREHEVGDAQYWNPARAGTDQDGKQLAKRKGMCPDDAQALPGTLAGRQVVKFHPIRIAWPDQDAIRGATGPC